MKSKIFESNVQLSEYVCGQISTLIQKKPSALICIAAGNSSLPIFEELLRAKQGGKLNFSSATFVAMDEWLGMNGDDEYSCGGFLKRNFLNEAGFNHYCLIDGRVPDREAECARVQSFIASFGAIDYLLFGIGPSGHVALNEPGTDPSLHVHVEELSPITESTGQKYFPGGAKLTGGITIGIANAKESTKVVLVINSEEKRAISARFLNEAPSSDVPATLLKQLKSFEVLFTEDACPQV